jgi:hypothetical protein
MKPGEISFALGLILLVGAAGLFPSVMIWMLGAVFIGPAAALVLIVGIFQSRNSGGQRSHRAVGLLLLACGLMALAFAALAGSAIAYRIAQPQAGIPPSWTTPWLLVRWVLPTPFLWFGLRLWTDWSAGRRRGWMVWFLAVPLATGVVHRTLTILQLLPLGA